MAFSSSKQKLPVCLRGFCLLGQNPTLAIWNISMTLPIVINVPTRAHWLSKTKGPFFLWWAHLNNQSNVCKQISSPTHQP